MSTTRTAVTVRVAGTIRSPATVRSLGGLGIPLSTALLTMLKGQSNNVGTQPAISTTQPYSNLRLNAGNSALVALVETTVESPASGYANQLSFLEPGRVSIVDNAAVSGTAIANLDIGSAPFNEAITSITAMSNLRPGTKRALVLLWSQGESDVASSAAAYRALLESLRTDYQTAVRTALGVDYDIHLVLTGLGNTPQTTVNDATVAQAHLEAALNSPFIHYAGNSYAYPHANGGADLHRTSEGARREGQYFAKAAHLIASGAPKPDPIHISNATAVNNVITVQLAGGDGSALVVDTTDAMSRHTLGFSYHSDNNAPSIISASLNADLRQVTLTLDRSVTSAHANKAVQYGYTAGTGALVGSGVAMNGGQIRDSDPTESHTGGTLPNWMAIQTRPLDSATNGAATEAAWGLTQSLTLGADDFATVPAFLTPGGASAATWLGWFRSGSADWGPATGLAGILTKRAGTSNQFELLALPNGSSRFDIATGQSTVASLTTPEGLFAGLTWYFIAITYAASTLTLWIAEVGTDATVTNITGSCTAVGTPPATIRSTNANAPMMFGCRGQLTEFWGPSNFRDVAFATSALSEANLNTLYNGGTPVNWAGTGITLPRSWWPLDGHTGDRGLVGAPSVRRFHAVRYRNAGFSSEVP